MKNKVKNLVSLWHVPGITYVWHSGSFREPDVTYVWHCWLPICVQIDYQLFVQQ